MNREMESVTNKTQRFASKHEKRLDHLKNVNHATTTQFRHGVNAHHKKKTF